MKHPHEKFLRTPLLEAVCWLRLGCWSNNVAKRHLSPGPFNSRVIGVRGGGSGRAAAPPGLEKFQGNSVFQGKRKLLKNPEYKKSTVNTVNSGHPLCFRAGASCSKILNVKSIFNTVKNSRAPLFSGQVQVAQNS